MTKRILTKPNLKSTSKVYVLTDHGFDTLSSCIKTKCKVYCVDKLGDAKLIDVSAWKSINSDTYKIWNRDNNTTCYCNRLSTIYACSDVDVTGNLFDLKPDSIGDMYKPRLFTHINIETTLKSISDKVINDIVRTRTLNTECFDCSATTIYQILDRWRTQHGRYSVVDYNQALLMQSILAKIGYCSIIENAHGLTVNVTTTQKSVDITDYQITHEVSINKLPVNKDGKHLHLIYSCNNNSFIM